MTDITRIIDWTVRTERGRIAGMVSQTDYADGTSVYRALDTRGRVIATDCGSLYLAECKVLRMYFSDSYRAAS